MTADQIITSPVTLKKQITGWLKAARPPFHTVGVMPLAVGSILAAKTADVFSWPVFIWSAIAVVLVMLSTYLNGEYHDMVEDRISGETGKSAFAGGSQSMFDGSVKHGSVRIAGYAAILLAIAIGLLLQFYYHTGVWTIPLGALGGFMGFFYSKPPLRLVNSGLGEIMIGFCYGWLPVAVGFYLQAGYISDMVHWISIPIACSIFNVILINEFPDYLGDATANKRNLTVRFGRNIAARIYISANVLSWVFYFLSVKSGAVSEALLYYVPIFLIGLFANMMVVTEKYLDRNKLEIICGSTIVTNLGTSLVYCLLISQGKLG